MAWRRDFNLMLQHAFLASWKNLERRSRMLSLRCEKLSTPFSWVWAHCFVYFFVLYLVGTDNFCSKILLLCHKINILLTDNFRKYPGRCPCSSRKQESPSQSRNGIFSCKVFHKMHPCDAKQETVKGIHHCTAENIKWTRYSFLHC